MAVIYLLYLKKVEHSLMKKILLHGMIIQLTLITFAKKTSSQKQMSKLCTLTNNSESTSMEIFKLLSQENLISLNSMKLIISLLDSHLLQEHSNKIILLKTSSSHSHKLIQLNPLSTPKWHKPELMYHSLLYSKLEMDVVISTKFNKITSKLNSMQINVK